MKNKKYIVKGTPIVPSFCGILMAVLWYMMFYYVNGDWSFQMRTVSFEGLAAMEIFDTLAGIVIPVLFFLGVLFLAELDVRWMLLPLLAPVAYQATLFVYFLGQDVPEYMFINPISFFTPFLSLILFALTLEKVIPTKWVFVGFCGVAVLLPLILTLCGVGEFAYAQDMLAEDYTIVSAVAYYWSDYLAFAFYYLGLGALVVQMRAPRPEDAVSVAEMKKAYEEKMAALQTKEDRGAAEELAEELPEELPEEPAEDRSEVSAQAESESEPSDPERPEGV